MTEKPDEPLRLAIAGLGAIGMTVARCVDQGGIASMRLAAVSARDVDKARKRVSDFSSLPAILPLEDLANDADIIVESVPAANFEKVARPALEKGRIFNRSRSAPCLTTWTWLTWRGKTAVALSCRRALLSGSMLSVQPPRAA